MFDKKKIDAVVNKIASRGGASDFSSRMAAGKAAKRASTTAAPAWASKPTRAAVSGKTLNAVKPPATKLPKPASGGSGPVEHTANGTGPVGKGHTINIRIGH